METKLKGGNEKKQTQSTDFFFNKKIMIIYSHASEIISSDVTEMYPSLRWGDFFN